MKKSISLIIAFAALLVITSCSNAHKACAAYAKHDTVDKTPNEIAAPLYKDLQ